MSKANLLQSLCVCCLCMAVTGLAAADGPCEEGPNGKVTICHVPPGNPDNAHTISVSPNAADAHLRHGDYCGPCESGMCEDDDDCGQGQICVDGECVAPPGCESDEDCPEGQICIDGECVAPPGCESDDDCPEGQICVDGECVTPPGCDSDADCPEGEICIDGECVPPGECQTDADCDDGNACTTDVCDPGVSCLHIAIDSCVDGDPCTVDHCDPEIGCVFEPLDCEDGDACTINECVDGDCTTAVIDCPEGQVCEDGECVSILDEVVLLLDIKPRRCPNGIRRGTNATVWVALLGTDDVAVADVDLGSLELQRIDGIGEAIAPTHKSYKDLTSPFAGELCGCHKSGKDGTVDLKMKFKTRDLVRVLALDDLARGSIVELVLTGTLEDGTPLSAIDCIRIVR